MVKKVRGDILGVVYLSKKKKKREPEAAFMDGKRGERNEDTVFWPQRVRKNYEQLHSEEKREKIVL